CNAASDCASLVCTGSVCQPATCSDSIKNGTESDVDCGGASCPPCNIGQKCGANGDCKGQSCSGGLCVCPSGMIVVPIPGGGTFCMDATEVTYAQYQAFYSANPSTAIQPAVCAWNVSWTPSGDWPQPPTSASEPVRYVNWCQAAAYCQYANRRLCGSIQ